MLSDTRGSARRQANHSDRARGVNQMAPSRWMNQMGVTSGLPSGRTQAIRISTSRVSRKASHSAGVMCGMSGLSS